MISCETIAATESNLTPEIKVLSLGLVPYRQAWELQQQLQRELILGKTSETIIFCEHPTVITLGRGAKPENVLISENELVRLGIEQIKIERGGDVTLHSPGQLVAYPILNLKNYQPDVGWYMRALEEVVIRTLAHFGVKGIRVPERTGVWLAPGPQKIASIGIRLSRWCTLHGLALNINNNLEHFSLIHPCGYKDIAMTSLEKALGGTEVPLRRMVEERCLQSFMEVLGSSTRKCQVQSERTEVIIDVAFEDSPTSQK